MLLLIRIALRLLTFDALRRFLQRLDRGEAKSRLSGRECADKISWSISAARRFAFNPDCLPQALAAKVMLDRRNCPASLRIGVARSGQGRIQAHAWVESFQVIVVGGGENLPRFTSLPACDLINRGISLESLPDAEPRASDALPDMAGSSAGERKRFRKFEGNPL